MPLEKSVAEAARETLLQIELLLACPIRTASPASAASIAARYVCDVIATYSALFSRPSILKASHAELHQRLDQIVRRQILRAEQILPVAGVAQAGHRRPTRTASGRPAHIGRDWRCGRRALRSSGTGRCRRRTVPRGRTLPAASASLRAIRPISSIESSRATITRSTPSRAHELDSARLGERHLRRAVNRQARRHAAESAGPAPDPARSPHRPRPRRSPR